MLLFHRLCQNFHLFGTMAATFYNQKTWTEWVSEVLFPRWSSLRSRVYKILSQPHNIWENGLFLWCCLELFIVCLAGDTTQITTAKQLGLSSIPLKGRVERYIWVSLGIAVLVRLQDVTSLAKPEKPHWMHRTGKSKKLQSLLTKNKSQRLNWRKSANRTRHQNRETAVFKYGNRKTEPKIGQIRKTENPNASFGDWDVSR